MPCAMLGSGLRQAGHHSYSMPYPPCGMWVRSSGLNRDQRVDGLNRDLHFFLNSDILNSEKYVEV